MIKVGLIGCGFMGGMHAACYAALENLGVTREDFERHGKGEFVKDYYE